ncbi:hypothetical protein FKG94_06805 [Exilibacterium tricleocarpae]|uniref:Hydrazine synthase alpha subunit middle domain-containing protein n=1 Tax=Exilibacterium tricleocarpae TaxID=2591008 RepID=A0A545TZ01_9GAMM|nr:hypothetical protein [Exilibacterium tricleocarpae]TQV82446.1 hypothetical protein FKG94_06805 [Exilibacterium tricleocarpae]
MQGLKRKSYIKITASALCAAVLSGCGGSGGGGDEQEPDPVVVDLPVAFIQRPVPVDENGERIGDNAREPSAFNPGAQLIVSSRASASAPRIVVTEGAFPEGELYDVKDVEASSDGEKIVFAMRAPEIEGLDEDEQPTWNIWEYDLTDNLLRRIIQTDITAEAGQDVAPHYLPDGRIVFSSTRQRRSRAILLDESKPQYSALDEDRETEAFVLHVMDADGDNIQQITFNQSHDLQPTVMSNGKVMFTRWDNVNNRNSFSLYTIDPDGHNLSFYYGFHSQDTGTDDSEARFFQPRELPDGRTLVSLRPVETDALGGDMVAIDGANYTEIDQPITANMGATGPGQASLSVDTVTTDGSISPHGRFSSADPLFDGTNRLLVSWSLCLLTDPTTNEDFACTEQNLANPALEEAAPRYGLWIYNLDDGSQRPVINAEAGVMYTEAITLEPRDAPTFIPIKRPGTDLDADLFNDGVGVVHIRSVYDVDGVDTSVMGIGATADPAQPAYADRAARFLRIVKAVPMPDEDVLDFDNSAFGVSRAQLMREIIGYVPIEPDGSVKFKVPADIPFAISILNADGRRISPRHQNWMQVAAGEERECSGCHTGDSEVPHGRMDTGPASINNGAPSNGQPFPNTNPALFADMGETMAEVYARINGVRTPSVDVAFTDEWVNPPETVPSIDYSYTQVGVDVGLATQAPTTEACQINWTPLCRITVNYEDHIQPLWERERLITDAVGNVIEDRTCVTCHNTANANNPDETLAGNLDLTSPVIQQNRMESYQELLANDSIIILVVDADGNPVFLTDEDGNFVDEDGNLIPEGGEPVQATIVRNLPRTMNPNGAGASNRFFSRFAAGAVHDGYLNQTEMRLIAEWLDLGAQYFNNPFDAPLD